MVCFGCIPVWRKERAGQEAKEVEKMAAEKSEALAAIRPVLEKMAAASAAGTVSALELVADLRMIGDASASFQVALAYLEALSGEDRNYALSEILIRGVFDVLLEIQDGLPTPLGLLPHPEPEQIAARTLN